ncbi:trafficking protein particle complex subunit 10-like [Ornithodoros turicata]
MDSKPIATYEGNSKLFQSLEPLLVEGLPKEPVEWKRSYGRGPKVVHVEATFVKFDENNLPKDECELHLLDQPYLHTYWTDCTDAELYRTQVKDDIIAWMAKLKAAHVYDWMLVAVEHADNRRGNKTKLLPRTTVFDRMKADFPSKTIERCVSLLDPLRSDTRAVESWQTLLVRLRQALLHACSRHMTRHEDRVRAQRERRTQPQWSFIDFFSLQEELAFMLEMLGLYDEALVQYDELDALFTQFVINSASGDMPEWLYEFASVGCSEWPGLCLKRGIKNGTAVRRLAQGASLLELRNYLFSRQCSLLLLLCRPWEMAHRTVSFLHNTVQELKILEVSMVPGSVACWVFLSCLEVLSTCERFNDSTQVEAYSLYTAGLWSYAREKLKELGELCYLMPNQTAGSEQLHMVVNLLSGMGEDPYSDPKTLTPHARLREALSSKESFLKHYLDLSEHTMITFKHIGRMRSARLVGKDLADLYIQMGEHRKAVPFLLDLLRTYTDESWTYLALLMQKEVACCYLATQDWPRFVRTSIQLSAQAALAHDQRIQHFEQARDKMSALQDAGGTPITMDANDILVITDAWLVPPKEGSQCWIAGGEVEAVLMVTSHIPVPVQCKKVVISVSRDDMGSKTTASQCPPESPVAVWGVPKGGQRVPLAPQMSVMEDVQKHDGSTAIALVCKNVSAVLARPDGIHFSRFPGEPAGAPLAEVSPLDFISADVEVVPGVNKISVKQRVQQSGSYALLQAYLQWEDVQFIQCCLPPQLSFTVIMESPSLQLHWPQAELLAGVKQKVGLAVKSGSCTIAEGKKVIIKASRGLLIKSTDKFAEDAVIILPTLEAFKSTIFDLVVMAPLGQQRDSRALEYNVTVTLSNDSSTIVQSVQLHFLPPFTSSHRVHTCSTRKYIQVVLQGLTSQLFTVGNASLVAHENNVFLKPLNSTSQLLRVNTEQAAYFLWEMLDANGEPIRLTFSVLYSYGSGEDLVEKTYNYDFRIENYKTLYAVKVRVEPSKGSEFCRAECACNMHISIAQLNPSDKNALMYEVVPDPAIWAVCGRTAGVVNVSQEQEHTVTLEVKPLIRGFLPLPTVRLSKYIPSQSPGSRSSSDGSGATSAKLEPFLQGQVYNWSRAMQVHVLAPVTASAGAPVTLEAS